MSGGKALLRRSAQLATPASIRFGRPGASRTSRSRRGCWPPLEPPATMRGDGRRGRVRQPPAAHRRGSPLRRGTAALRTIPARRQCALASVTSLTFDGDVVVRVDYAEPAGATAGRIRRRSVMPGPGSAPGPGNGTQVRSAHWTSHEHVDRAAPLPRAIESSSPWPADHRRPHARCLRDREGRGRPAGGWPVSVRRARPPRARRSRWPTARPRHRDRTCSTAATSDWPTTRARSSSSTSGRSWCTPCQTETPQFDLLYRSGQGPGRRSSSASTSRTTRAAPVAHSSRPTTSASRSSATSRRGPRSQLGNIPSASLPFTVVRRQAAARRRGLPRRGAARGSRARAHRARPRDMIVPLAANGFAAPSPTGRCSSPRVSASRRPDRVPLAVRAAAGARISVLRRGTGAATERRHRQRRMVVGAVLFVARLHRRSSWPRECCSAVSARPSAVHTVLLERILGVVTIMMGLVFLGRFSLPAARAQRSPAAAGRAASARRCSVPRSGWRGRRA